jgi:hypothetical protein
MTSTLVPVSKPDVAVVKMTLDTDDRAERASPRKPRVER